ncbi:PIN/TRAM domain-containing protein [uncultured Limosilactobacillus sp.]|uniref:PIN/TRAM domain-containing protein n=1 Tax=uncultured Limosilactobacillus sp. TaxID=2837629 RepID=UPI0025E4E660|nr:PIN/TRAM domain-containing protein [uncultured Limosilactobacillus sp.]
MRKRLIRLLFLLVGAAMGFYYLPLFWLAIHLKMPQVFLVFVDIITGALIFWLLSFAMTDWIVRLIKRVEKQLSSKSPVYIIIGSLAMIIGLVLAILISIPLWRTSIPVIDNILPILLMIAFSYFGFQLGTTRIDDWKTFFGKAEIEKPSTGKVMSKQDENYHHYKILDTNILIDGRIYDLVKTGFLEGTLLVPNFVLYELQYIADAGESIKRVRGRRGLDILNKLRTEKIVPIEMSNEDFPDIKEVDSKLIALAKKVDGVIVTNDYNLNKVIQFQNVQVLNINNLAKSLRPRVIPGERMEVKVVKKGTERQQGVAYLDDGTMVVIEDGRFFMNKEVMVEVTSALQTDAGRMIFARMLHSTKGLGEKHDEKDHHQTKQQGKSNQQKK